MTYSSDRLIEKYPKLSLSPTSMITNPRSKSPSPKVMPAIPKVKSRSPSPYVLPAIPKVNSRKVNFHSIYTKLKGIICEVFFDFAFFYKAKLAKLVEVCIILM